MDHAYFFVGSPHEAPGFFVVFSDPPKVTCSFTNLLPSFILPTQASNSSNRLLDSEVVSWVLLPLKNDWIPTGRLAFKLP